MGATTVTQSQEDLGRFLLHVYSCTAANGKYSTDVLCFSHRQITYQTDMTAVHVILSRTLQFTQRPHPQTSLGKGKQATLVTAFLHLESARSVVTSEAKRCACDGITPLSLSHASHWGLVFGQGDDRRRRVRMVHPCALCPCALQA